MRGMADFEPDYATSHFLSRETVVPPPSLLSKVWPELDGWWNAHLNPSESTEQVEVNMAAGAFLELLVKLRMVFLQDSVFYRVSYPSHPIFKDPLFSSPEYVAFSQAMHAGARCSTAEEDPHYVAVQKAIPELAAHMRENRREIRQAAENSAKRHDETQEILLGIRHDYTLLRKHIERSEGCYTWTPHKPGVVPRDYESLQTREELSPSLRPIRAALPAAPPLFSLPPRSLGGPAPCAPSAIQSLGVESSTPQFMLSRSIHTVPDLWTEWTIGTPGSQSVDELDRQYGSSWRPQPKERQYYSIRKVIIDELRRRAGARLGGLDANIGTVVEEMEEERLVAKASLPKISQILKKARQGM